MDGTGIGRYVHGRGAVVMSRLLVILEGSRWRWWRQHRFPSVMIVVDPIGSIAGGCRLSLGPAVVIVGLHQGWTVRTVVQPGVDR